MINESDLKVIKNRNREGKKVPSDLKACQQELLKSRQDVRRLATEYEEVNKKYRNELYHNQLIDK